MPVMIKEKINKFVPVEIQYDENLFNDFRKYFPDGQIEKINNFSVFKIDF